MKGDKLGRQGGSQEQPRMETMKGDGGSGSQEEPRREMMKGDKLGRQGGKQQPRAGSGSQEQPRMEIMKRDKPGREGGSGSQEQPRMSEWRSQSHKAGHGWETTRQRQPRAAQNGDNEGR